ncbi:MAG: sulfatase-like hydrolase/transferase [Bacteroidetes Order II. Incertae sedis bacterium]|nr:sulfatase-like hydrolase/transferase [Bacteroidetes Order II. bacterium]
MTQRLLLFLAVLLTSCSPRPEMNVILVIVDDLGWKDLTVTGSELYQTPHIDAFAESAVRFERFYADSPVCSPTRAALMTGKHPARLDITNWIGGEQKGQLIQATYERHLPLEETTIAERFKEAGYATGFIGKWHFGAGYDYYGTEIGFRFTLPYLGQSRTNRIQAKNAVIASQIDNRAITLDLKKKAEFAWHGYETARLAAERFIQKQSEMANRLLQLTREGYQLGELDLLTVLDTQRTYLAVQSGYYRALKDYYLSAINMEELVGRELIFQSKND